MNFPTKFIRTINSLNKDANVRVLVNGFRTKQVPINKSVRQRDPLSSYLFLLAVEPLVATINNDMRIEGLGKGRKRNVKCPSYADDLTLTLVGSPSVCLAFEIIERFSEATGLKLNMEKTQDNHDGWLLVHRRSFTFNKLAKPIHKNFRLSNRKRESQNDLAQYSGGLKK